MKSKGKYCYKLFCKIEINKFENEKLRFYIRLKHAKNIFLICVDYILRIVVNLMFCEVRNVVVIEFKIIHFHLV